MVKTKLLSSSSTIRFYSEPGDHCLACVSAIVGNGGYRVVISKPELLWSHINEGEQAYTVPDYWVWEPVPHEAVPAVVAVAERYMNRMTNRRYELDKI